jgi:thioredoxin-related protein
MLLDNVIQRYITELKRNPMNVTELNNYIKKEYILGELGIVEYKKLAFELDQRYPELSAS